MMHAIPPFDPDFASSAEWAAMYRAVGLQVVPARYPMRDDRDKRPKLSEWGEFTEALVPEAVFGPWFPLHQRLNMGLISGRCSRNIFVVDLDEHKNPAAREWWATLLLLENHGMDLDTWAVRTGGGGRHKLFQAPEGWHCPTNRTPLGVDIRGQGGFAMLPHSVHHSGREYEWEDGCAPWEIECAEAPQWLLDAIDRLVEQSGGDQRGTERQERTPSPETDFDAFGARIDGREDAMRAWVWRSVLELHRSSGGLLLGTDERDAREASLAEWLRRTKTRLQGVPNEVGLERECRGRTAFEAKWKKAMAKWAGPIAKQAADRPFIPDASLHFSPNAAQNASNAENISPNASNAENLILSASQFVAGFVPPHYLIDGVVQRGYVYSLTAKTGHGKTAVGMLLGQCIARGIPFAGREVEQGAVLMLAGENPDDVRARFLVLAAHHGFDPGTVPFHFVAGVIDIEAELPRIHAEAANIPNLALVIVDTAAAYFKGDDGNSNAQMGAYARLLRQLSFLPGKPAVIIPSHPAKHAGKENLTPVGGGAFLNEVDGNLSLWADAERHTQLHWQGKFRGPEFEPMNFRMLTVTSERVVDANGVLMPSVVAEPVTEAQAAAAESQQLTDTVNMMFALDRHRNATIVELARACRFISEDGKAQKSKVFRVLQKLLDDKLAERVLGKYQLTTKGKKHIGKDDD